MTGPVLLLQLGPDALVDGLRRRLRDGGLPVDALDLDPRQGDGELLERLRQHVATLEGGRPILVGFSRGARLLAQVADEVEARALLSFGYPFHRRGDPGDRHGWRVLQGLRTPTLVVQGERDPHGSRAQLTGWPALPPIHWVPDGNHRLHPRARSGLDPGTLLDEAVAASLAFLEAHA